jgi:predicted Zn-dependent protease
MGKDKILELLKEIVPSDCPSEIVAVQWNQALCRFSSNRIHQNSLELQTRVWLKVMHPQGIGVVQLNSLAPDDLRWGIQRARDYAINLNLPGPAFPLTGTTSFREVNLWDQETADASPHESSERVAQMIKWAEKAGLDLAGALETKSRELAIVNSEGLAAYSKDTTAIYHTVAYQQRDNATGYGYTCSRALSGLEMLTATMEAASKCQASIRPKAIPPGLYTVILEPAAVAGLLYFLARLGFNGLAWHEGRSPFPELGKTYLSEEVTIWDDGLDPRGLAMPFDFQGTPKRRLNLVKEGSVLNVAMGNLLAARSGRPATGHGTLPGDSQGPVPQHIFMEPGNAMLEDMITTTKNGILITRFHFLNLLDPCQAIITGTTRDGTLLVENGFLRGATLSLRMVQSLAKAFKQIEMVGDETRLFALPWGSIRVPALKIRDFTITGSGH